MMDLEQERKNFLILLVDDNDDLPSSSDIFDVD